MKDLRIRLLLKWYDFYYAIIYPYSMFLLWKMVVTNDPYLDTIGESRRYFWDSLSFNQYF